MPTTSQPALQVSGLRKSFGAVTAVDGVDLTITPGEVVALLGPNGAGKTTMLDLMLGLQRPDSGTVRILGTGTWEAVQSGRIGAVLQEGDMLQGATVRELVSTMSALTPRPMALTDVFRHAELDSLLDRKTDKLSGGETQRVRFALALVGDPELLVLDEPTAAMDVTARRSFWHAVRGLAAAGRTIVFSTHYLEEADAIADRIVLMAGGRIVADGPTTTIRSIAAARVIRFTLPGADPAAFRPWEAEIHGDTVAVRSADSDRALRDLLAAFPAMADIEVAPAPLADAVLALTIPSEEKVPA